MGVALFNFPPGRAAVFIKPGEPFQMVTARVPNLKPAEILVKTRYTTLCGSDIHTYCGRRIEPERVVLGHEIVGDILWVGPGHTGKDFRGNDLKEGDRITWSIFSVPPRSAPPRVDLPQKSKELFKYGHALASEDDIFNGGLAQYCVLRDRTAVIKIGKFLPLKVAATINCAHATVTGALRMVGHDLKGKNVLIYGAGLLGLSCSVMCAEAAASWVGLVDQDDTRLRWGSKFGASACFKYAGAQQGLAAEWPSVDVVFDMTGDPEAIRSGLESLKTGGTAVWIGAVYPADPVSVDAQLVVRKILQIRGLHNYNYDDFDRATSFIETNYAKYPFEELVEKEFTLNQVGEAFEFASKYKPVRVGIVVD